MGAIFPAEVIQLICEELALTSAFSTLLNLSLSSKQNADSGLLWLYRVHERSPVRSGESSEGTRVVSFTAQQAREQRAISKWASQWRSVILSSLGKTAYPYCFYIRSLELSNLQDLLEDPTFTTLREDFFANDMDRFMKAQELPTQTKKRKRKFPIRLAVSEILELVGESISGYCAETALRIGGTAALDEVSGHINGDALTRWVGRLSRLKALRLFDGSVLDGETARVIKAGCSTFNSLTLLRCTGDQADSQLSDFFFGLRPNSMQNLQMLSSNALGASTFVALSTHGESMTHLTLRSLAEPAVRSLHLLKGCTRLQSFTLEIDLTAQQVDLQGTQNDTYNEIVAWLTSCTALKSIRFEDFLDGANILSFVCLEKDINLKKLELVVEDIIDEDTFHLVLRNQTSLESLELRTDTTTSHRSFISNLTSSLCELKALRSLNLIETSETFENQDLHKLTSHLLKLEDFTVSGLNVDDALWPSLSNLRQLHTLSFPAITKFTFEGIMSYVCQLQPTNTDLDLSIMSSHIDFELSPNEIDQIKATLKERVNGTFQFMLWRDPAESEYDSDSD